MKCQSDIRSKPLNKCTSIAHWEIYALDLKDQIVRLEMRVKMLSEEKSNFLSKRNVEV
jgi:hypothetical protein